MLGNNVDVSTIHQQVSDISRQLEDLNLYETNVIPLLYPFWEYEGVARNKHASWSNDFDDLYNKLTEVRHKMKVYAGTLVAGGHTATGG
ncbi:MAG: hypothetical protein AAGJ80_07005, partial [Cyanobacteria bacterium J06553_1]